MMFERTDFDLIVIGSGAGGSVGAAYARSLGKKVALVEKAAVLGGECPNWACVPTKALLKASQVYQTAKNASEFGVSTGKVGFSGLNIRKWRDLAVSRTGAVEDEKWLKQQGIELIRGEAVFTSGKSVDVNGKSYSAKRFLVASGSEAVVPEIKGLKEAGYLTSDQAAEAKSLPKSVFIIGGGPIGCEFAQFYSDLGLKVTIAEAKDRLLLREEPEASALLANLFKARGVKVLAGCEILKVEKKGKSKIVHYKSKKKGSVRVDEILIATGKKPNLCFEPSEAGIKIQDGAVKANQYLQTSNPRVFIAGDNAGPLLFTHAAAYQSRIAVHNAFNRRKVKPSYTSIPRVTFVRPEVASVGLSGAEAKRRGIKVKSGLAATGELGRANTSNEFDGFVKVVTDRKGVILGACIVAPRAGEMIHELALAVKLNATAVEVGELVHAFPTYSEAIKIACSNIS